MFKETLGKFSDVLGRAKVLPAELLVFPALADERHGLGGRGGAHAGRRAVPCGDGGGRAAQPALGALNDAA